MDQIVSNAPRDLVAVAAPRLEGGLDRVSPDGTVEGWLWAPDDPGGMRTAIVTIDGHAAARAACDRPRADLVTRPGAGAFVLRLSEPTPPPGAEIALRDLATGQQVGAARRVGREAAVASLSGNVDRVTRDGWVSGWAWDTARPHARLTLEILVDEVVVSSTAAMIWRADLQQAGIGDGAHGFAVALPYDVILRRGGVRVSVREAGSRRPLGPPTLLRTGRPSEAERRVEELEHQVLQLQGRIDALLREAQDRSSGEERQARAVFASAAAYFREMADGTAPGGAGFGGSLRATLDALTELLPALTLDRPDRPRALLLLPATGKLEQVHRCLRGLHAIGADRIADILVLDPGVADASTALLPGLVPGLRYRRCDPAGLVASCNAAIAASTAPAIVFLDPHVEPAPDSLLELLATLEAEPEAGVVGAALEPMPEPAVLYRADAPPAAFCAVRRDRLPDGLRADGTDLGTALAALCGRLVLAGRENVVQPVARAEWTGPKPGASPDRRAMMTTPVGRVLVVDDRLPRPEHDAGSVITLAQMVTLRRLGWHVTFAPANGPPASAAERTLLERRGIAPALPPKTPSVTHALREHSTALDLVLLVRHTNYAALAPRVRALAPQAKLVFCPADLHFLRAEREAALAGRRRATPSLRRLRAQELACVADADATLLMSDHEQALLAAESDPAKLHLLRWIATPARDVPGFRDRQGLLFVGNFGHRPNVDAILWCAETILPELRRRRPGLLLHVVGADPPREVAALAGADIAVHGPVADLDGLLDRARLSVAPLRYGAGFKGKVAVSLARRVPVVGTAIALEGTGLADGDGVVLADDPTAFAAAIARLHDDDEAWEAASLRAAERVEALYAPGQAAEVFGRLLGTLGLPVRQPRPDAGAASDAASSDDRVVDP